EWRPHEAPGHREARCDPSPVGCGLSAATGDELAGDADLLVRRHGEAELTGSHLDPSRRPQRRHLDLELAEKHLQAGPLDPRRVELVAGMDLLGAQPDDRAATPNEGEPTGPGEPDRAPA